MASVASEGPVDVPSDHLGKERLGLNLLQLKSTPFHLLGVLDIHLMFCLRISAETKQNGAKHRSILILSFCQWGCAHLPKGWWPGLD